MPKDTTSHSKSKSKIPRPPNSWILFRADTMRDSEFRANHPKASQSMMSKVISAMWRNASQEVKDQYELHAEKAKLDHMIKYPDYHFCPRKNPERSKGGKQNPKTRKRERNAEVDGNLNPASETTVARMLASSPNSQAPPMDPPLSPSTATPDDNHLLVVLQPILNCGPVTQQHSSPSVSRLSSPNLHFNPPCPPLQLKISLISNGMLH
ncbi:high mobility group box domain-containing protein [Lentinula aciculospora]|uniref:High mobility group box domain-containing protein n=1 Tax=Lentinula aciculospora TaxID=153920 RepID=A0A9W9A549_9AGAR|nr:high mobility group box domain-containing protein [Lentinula aciculospora]